MKNIVITGANRGIGLEFAKKYSQTSPDSHHVYALCRNASPELSDLDNVTIIDGFDVGNLDSIKAGIAKCPSHIDILINNAGILQRTSLDTLLDGDIAKINDQFQINALAPLMVVAAAKTKLGKGSKIALITSRMGSIGDNGSGTNYGYRMSKAALNAAGKSLAIDLRETDISVAILHPGWVKTEMTNNSGLITPQEAAASLIKRISELNLTNSGTFWHSNGEILEW